ncbi:DUF1127 domain-containing protein [Sabulicella glaciei]|uniref:DUF1127 domain-containing protein n=1 Tax=Sabulicella glaciei TaxID=2984948 RepID=A0ABT3NXM5_9PROT|nr:DUF1127 domain-containing protein [Roseococcus sp. MDT2-1-1]MCW8086925.1 DUF1127 domain-containing protein [Roseococcus sp. MDT2-1-1]
MNSRITSAEAALLMPAISQSPSARRVEVLLAEARRARDEELMRRVAGFFRGFGRILAAIRHRHETVRQLRALSDRELADIGLNRSNIGAAAAQAVPMPANDGASGRRAA